MDSGTTTVNDFEYTVHDFNGIVGVDKEGNKHPISEEEWQKAHPEHKNIECKECAFVQDGESLFTFFVSRDLKEKATEKPVFVGKFTMPNWIGHSGFYIFRCKECGEVSVDYPHGYTDHGLMYLACCYCREKLPLEAVRDRSIYEREETHVPKLKREERIQELNEVIADVESRGVRVVTVFSEDSKRSKVGFSQFLRDYFSF
ncbi:MAG: hypothetical protein HYX22_00455 [Candidatus Yanofskybacteria bacterium]|nr:hypothetical protein [Candidatus Yanofskybacteria bacterium]